MQRRRRRRHEREHGIHCAGRNRQNYSVSAKGIYIDLIMTASDPGSLGVIIGDSYVAITCLMSNLLLLTTVRTFLLTNLFHLVLRLACVFQWRLLPLNRLSSPAHHFSRPAICPRDRGGGLKLIFRRSVCWVTCLLSQFSRILFPSLHFSHLHSPSIVKVRR